MRIITMLSKQSMSWFPEKAFRSISVFFLLITVIAVFVPFWPDLPSGGLDPSWAFALNQAVAQHLAFGKDIVFTFGPYASVYTRIYSPATTTLMYAGTLYLGISYWLCLTLLMRKANPLWIWVYCLFLVTFISLRDPLFLSYALVAALSVYQLLKSESLRCHPFYLLALASVILFPLGLLVLIKGSLIVICLAVVVLCSSMSLVIKRFGYAAYFLLLFPLSTLIFWFMAGQSITNLPLYLANMFQIVFGYTTAQSSKGDLRELIPYLASCTWILVTVLSAQRVKGPRLFIALTFCVYLFMAFKMGFVRHDIHAVTSGTCVLIASLLLPSIVDAYLLTTVAILLSVFSWSFINGHYIGNGVQRMLSNSKLVYVAMWVGTKKTLQDNNWRADMYHADIQALKSRGSLPLLPGRSDIYSYDQTSLIASGNHWDPRPIFQSYSAYTPMLADINKSHLLGANAPENIFFSVQPIDNRLPSLEDGPSWPVLIDDYHPVSMANGYLVLHRNGVASSAKRSSEISSGTYELGHSIDVPTLEGPILAKILIKPTIVGSLAGLLFKPNELRIKLELVDGTKAGYRFITGMASSGFVISPLIADTSDFALLYAKSGYLSYDAVRSFTIEPASGSGYSWQKQFNVSFSRIESATQDNVLKLLNFNQAISNPSQYKVVALSQCNGSIDVVNGITPAPAQLTVAGVLHVSGWLADSIAQGTVPNSTYIVLRNAKGKSRFIRTERTYRPDLGVYFKKPALSGAGYSSLVDVSDMQGQYTLGLAKVNGREIQICDALKINVTIKQ